MKRNIAVVTAMMFLFAGISMGAQAADEKAAAEASTSTPAAKKAAAPMHKHHVTHHKAATPATPAPAADKPADK